MQMVQSILTLLNRKGLKGASFRKIESLLLDLPIQVFQAGWMVTAFDFSYQEKKSTTENQMMKWNLDMMNSSSKNMGGVTLVPLGMGGYFTVTISLAAYASTHRATFCCWFDYEGVLSNVTVTDCTVTCFEKYITDLHIKSRIHRATCVFVSNSWLHCETHTVSPIHSFIGEIHTVFPLFDD